jgi:penicillin-binding protein 1A
MNLGKTPCTVISNADFVQGKWRVSEGGGAYTMKDALAKSLNPVAVRLMDEVGPKNVIRLARDLGVTEDIPDNLSTALGSSEITIYEMLGAYSTFANYGNYIKPEMVWRIEDANGRLIKEVKPVEKEVMDETILLRDMESGVQETVAFKKIKDKLEKKVNRKEGVIYG